MNNLPRNLLLSILFSMVVFQLAFAEDKALIKEGEKLFNQYCASCHGAAPGMDMSKRLGPPVFMIWRHYVGTYPDEMTFVEAIADWVETRDISTSLMPGAIRRFNIMPPIAVEREKVEKIALYLYFGDIKKPQQFERQYRQQHGLPGQPH